MPLPSQASMWNGIFKGLKNRELTDINLILTDNLTGINQSIHRAFHNALFQKRIIHLMRNLSNKVRTDHKESFCSEMKNIFDTTASEYQTQGTAVMHKKKNTYNKRYAQSYLFLEIGF